MNEMKHSRNNCRYTGGCTDCIQEDVNMKKIKLKKDFIASLHKLIHDNSNTLIGIEISRECKEFAKKIEKCSYEYNNQ